MAVTQGVLGRVVVVVVVGFSGGGGVCAITWRVRHWLAPLGSTTQASASKPLSRARSSRSALAVYVWSCTQAPLALPPSPKLKK